jgi:hypothetical protein
MKTLLAQRFFLLPATLQGVDRLIEQFELVDPKPWEEVVKQVGDASKESIVFREDLMTTLEQHFSPHMLQWIAACAVYPQLQWKMTLAPGQRTLHGGRQSANGRKHPESGTASLVCGRKDP